MTIRKTSATAKALLTDAHAIRCYSLFNSFNGQKLTNRPTLRIDGQLKEVSEQEFLAAQLFGSDEARLTRVREHRYCIRLNSNLWYEFESLPEELAPHAEQK